MAKRLKNKEIREAREAEEKRRMEEVVPAWVREDEPGLADPPERLHTNVWSAWLASAVSGIAPAAIVTAASGVPFPDTGAAVVTVASAPASELPPPVALTIGIAGSVESTVTFEPATTLYTRGAL